MPERSDLLSRVHEFAVAAFKLLERFSNASAGRPAAEQFYRSASSTEANYRAAKRGRSTAEFIAKLGVVVEEIDEAVGWLEHMRDTKIADDPDLLSEAMQLRRIFGRSLGTARRNYRERLKRISSHDGKRRPASP